MFIACFNIFTHCHVCMHTFVKQGELFSIDKQTFAMVFFSIRQEFMVFLFQFDNVCYEVSNEFLVFGKICCSIGNIVNVLKKNNTPLRIMSMYPLHHNGCWWVGTLIFQSSYYCGVHPNTFTLLFVLLLLWLWSNLLNKLLIVGALVF
jgi:hypothetical protein